LPPTEIAEAMGAAITEKQTRFHFPHRLASGEVRSVQVDTGPVEMEGRILL